MELMVKLVNVWTLVLAKLLVIVTEPTRKLQGLFQNSSH